MTKGGLGFRKIGKLEEVESRSHFSLARQNKERGGISLGSKICRYRDWEGRFLEDREGEGVPALKEIDWEKKFRAPSEVVGKKMGTKQVELSWARWILRMGLLKRGPNQGANKKGEAPCKKTEFED